MSYGQALLIAQLCRATDRPIPVDVSAILDANGIIL